MVRLLLPILFLTTLSACGTTRPVVADPPTPPRGKPLEAMQACGELATLPATVTEAPLEEALREVLRAKIRSDAVFHECATRHEALVRWINED